MRLTLRTLLSYLDNVLDPAARAELEKQIASNENAGEWLHRTSDVMRRLKLGTPEIDGTSSVDDPNTVAEYLDRTLPEESVAEFERVCLESDAMLAEVASCHHVLAMVLTDKPPIDPDTQKRLHRLQADLAEAMRSRVEMAHAKPAAEAAAPPAPAEPPQTRRTKLEPQAPAYLREGGGSPIAKWAPAIAALLLLSVVSLLAFRPGGWLNPTPEAIAKNEGTDSSESPEVVEATPRNEPVAVDTESDEEVDPAPVLESTGKEGEGEAPAEPTETPDPTIPAAEPGEIPAEPTEPETELAGVTEPSDEANPEPTAETDPVVEPVAEPAVEPSTETEPVVAQPEETPTVPIRFLGNAETLVVREAEPGSWRRLIGGAALAEPVRIVSLPTYRSRYDLGDGVSLELVGLTEASLTPVGPEAPQARIDLAYGRIVLRHAPPAAKPEQGDEVNEADAPAEPAVGKAEVIINGIPYLATLGPNAVLSIAADRPFVPGHPVLEMKAPLVAMAHGLAGKIEWSSDDVGLTTSKPRPWIIAGDENAQVPASLSDPAWVDQLPLTKPDGYASPELARAVAADLPIWPQLLQIAVEEKFGEIRSLASRCSLALGHPDRLVESFRDPNESALWEANLSELREAASRDTGQAGEVQRVFAEAFGERTAEELVDLLIGFEPEEVGLDAEAVVKGVVPESVLPALQSDDLATRVLASLVLKETIQPLDRPYKPLATPRTRLKSTRWIESQLEKGELEPAVH